MDPFRLLVRSTNLQKNKHLGITAKALPSAGSPESPQIFGPDNADGTPTKKRKREQDGTENADMDFFNKGEKRKKEAKEKDRQRQSRENIVDEDPGWMTEDECKKILRRHKLKVTILDSTLADRAGENKEHEKKKKKPQQVYPQPVMSFGQLRSRYGLSKRIVENINAQGFTIPTEVQLGSLPLLLGSNAALARSEGVVAEAVDLVTVAPTGSGKTLAFLVPVLDSIMRQKHTDVDSVECTRAIILAPTRELAYQIVDEGRKLAKGTSIKITAMRKGLRLCDDAATTTKTDLESESEDEDETHTTILKSDILVSTPIALLNALTSRGGVGALPNICHLVLDEADALLDELFRTETLAIWKACTSSSLRVSFWSATISSSVEALALSTHKSHAGKSTAPSLHRLVVGIKDSALSTVTHRLVYTATEAGKLLGLRQLLHPTSPPSFLPADRPLHPPFLIFTKTIERAKALYEEIRYDVPASAGGSARMAVLHSEMTHAARLRTLREFRGGSIWILITTDVLARGVDLQGINAVVSFDIASSAAQYVHRAGRTGRAGRGGVAVTFFTEEDVPVARSVATVVAAADADAMPPWLLASLPRKNNTRNKK